MLYMINHGAVSYGANTILTNINFEINAGQKIAVVGRNGCGKTTLLKLIEGEVALEKRDSDEDIYIAKSGNPVIGYLKQIAFADETISMETEVRKVFEPYREKQRSSSESKGDIHGCKHTFPTYFLLNSAIKYQVYCLFL